MTLVFSLLTVQTLLGALDTLWNHEMVRAPAGPPCRRHRAGACTPRANSSTSSCSWPAPGANGMARGPCCIVARSAAGSGVTTIADFVIEDRTRRLPAFERVLHTALHAVVWRAA